MAKNSRQMAQRRAKKKARESARRKQRKHEQTKATGNRFFDMGCTRAEFERAPIHAAYVSDAIVSQGIGYVIVARKLPSGQIAAGVFLVDAYCLGVKDAFLMVQSPLEFKDTIKTRFLENGLKEVEPSHARKLTEDAISYARDLGFEPHADYRDASVVLGNIDPTECTEVFTLGRDGKPLYISGPNDSENRIRQITTQLKKRCGPDGSHYLVGLRDPSEADSLGLDGRIIREGDD